MTPKEMADIHASAFATQRPWSADEFAALLASQHVFQVDYEQSFALGRVIAGECELLTIATQKDHQGKGLGRACLAAFLDKSASLNATTIFLEVDETNGRAIALYQSVGFSESGRRKDYYAHPDGHRSDAILMIFIAS